MPNSNQYNKDSNLYSRLSEVERDISKVTAEVGFIRSELGELSTSLKALAGNINQFGKPNYGVFIGFAGVMLTMVTFYTNLTTTPIKNSIDRVVDLIEEVDRRSHSYWTIDSHNVYRQETQDDLNKLDEDNERTRSRVRSIEKTRWTKEDAIRDRDFLMELIRNQCKPR